MFDVTFEREGVFGQLKIHAEMIGADRFDLGDDGTKFVALEGIAHRFHKFIWCVDERDVGAACAASDSGEVGDAFCCVGGEPTSREQAAVVEDDMGHIFRPITGHRRQRSHIHQHRAIAIEHDHLLIRPM